MTHFFFIDGKVTKQDLLLLWSHSPKLLDFY